MGHARFKSEDKLAEVLVFNDNVDFFSDIRAVNNNAPKLHARGFKIQVFEQAFHNRIEAPSPDILRREVRLLCVFGDCFDRVRLKDKLDILRLHDGNLLVSEHAGDRLALLNSKGGFTKYIGTEEFMSPEVKEGKYSFKADIYSFGLTLIISPPDNSTIFFKISISLSESSKVIKEITTPLSFAIFPIFL